MIYKLLADRRGQQALDQRQPNDGDDASPTNHQNPINHAHRSGGLSSFRV